MRFFDGPDHVRRARHGFDEAGFTLDGLTERLGVHAFAHLGQGELAPLIRATREGDRLDTLLRLFVFGVSVPLAAAQAFEDHSLLVQPVGRQQQRDRLADHFCGAVAEHGLGGAVPGGDHALERLADDRVLGRFDDAREVLPQLATAPGLGDVVVDLGHQRRGIGGRAMQRLVADDDDSLSVAAPVMQFDVAARAGEFGSQQVVRDAANRLGRGKPVEPLHAVRPIPDFAAEAAGQYLGQAQSGRLRLQ